MACQSDVKFNDLVNRSRAHRSRKFKRLKTRRPQPPSLCATARRAAAPTALSRGGVAGGPILVLLPGFFKKKRTLRIAPPRDLLALRITGAGQ